MFVRAPSSDSLDQNVDLFRSLSSEYSDYASEAGVKLVPFHNPALPLFRELPELARREVIQALEVATRICRNTRAQGKTMGDAPSLTWQALKEIGLRPPSDLFSYIADCNVIEVYSPRNIQLFRTFSFFQFCSYSLEELYCSDWLKLFERDNPEVVNMILDFAGDVFEGRVKRTVPLNHIPPHLVRETLSEGRLVSEMRIHWGSPLFLDGTSEAGAAIVLENCTLLEASRALSDRPQLNIVPLDTAFTQPF